MQNFSTPRSILNARSFMWLCTTTKQILIRTRTGKYEVSFAALFLLYFLSNWVSLNQLFLYWVLRIDGCVLQKQVINIQSFKNRKFSPTNIPLLLFLHPGSPLLALGVRHRLSAAPGIRVSADETLNQLPL